MKFYIVDAFTDTLFGGNPAGVVILPDGSDFPSDEIMVKTAAGTSLFRDSFYKTHKRKRIQYSLFYTCRRSRPVRSCHDRLL